MHDPENQSIQSYRSRWVVPVNSPKLSDGVVSIRQGRIVDVRPFSSFTGDRSSLHDLGDVVLIPGLVNSHTHLEFSDLKTPIGRQGIEFTEWIRAVVAQRREQGTADKSHAIREGIEESRLAGVVAIGEIATRPYNIEAYSGDLDITMFVEQLGRNAEYALEQFGLAEHQIAAWSSDLPHKIRPGLSPHAPYSVHPELFDSVLRSAKKNSLPVAMHLAETRQELQLISDQTGAFRHLLKDLNAWNPDSFRNDYSIKGYLEKLGNVHRGLVIHGNYLNEDEIQLIAQLPGLSVVFCPRTHSFFAHEAYPLDSLRRAGINIALGTDSRASNPDLNLFREMQEVYRKFPGLDWLEILKMGTICGAKALGIDDWFGTIETGKVGQLAVVRMTGSVAGPESLFSPDAIVLPVAEFESES